MSEFPIPLNSARGLALARACESMLRAAGGEEVVFRLPFPVMDSGNSTRRELALELAAEEEFSVSPVLVQTKGTGLELLLPSKSLEPHLRARGQTADEFLGSASCVVVQGRTLWIDSFGAERFAGSAYLWRISAHE